MTFCKSDYNSYNIYAMYISFVCKLPMVIDTYHSEPEVNLRRKKFKAFSDVKNTQWGNFVIFR